MKKILLLVLLATLPFFSYAREATIVKYNNPGLVVELSVGLWGIPLPADYDGDGVMDVVMVCPDVPYGGTYYFHNIGSAAKPLFDKAVRLSARSDANVRFSEWGGQPYVLTPGKMQKDFFRDPFGDAVAVEFEGDVPWAGIRNMRSNMWNVVDWDGDGDADIVVGFDSWDEYGWDNAFDASGKWKKGPLHGYVCLLENTEGKYVSRGLVKAGGKVIDTYGSPVPCIADFDGDGDLDLICGEFLDGLTWFENTGTREEPVFAEGRRLLDRKRHEVRFHVQMIVPVAVDFDGDGRTDLLVGDEDGTVSYLHNSGRVRDDMPVFDDQCHFMQRADVLKFGALSTPCSYDWNKDGREDLICGNSAGEICFIENLSGGNNPVWAAPRLFRVGKSPLRVMAGENGSVQGPAERKWGYTVLDVADWDGDGRADLIVNSIFGKVEWYRNAGSKDGLALEAARPVEVSWEGATPTLPWNWWTPQDGTLVTQWRTSPVVIDWNGDGILDLIMLDTEGYLALYEGFVRNGKHILKPGIRCFRCGNGCVYDNVKGIVDASPGILRLNARKAGASGRRKICFTDWDADGRLDLIVDGRSAVWFRQLEQDGNETLFRYMGDLADTKLEGHTTCPTPMDWNGDGISDLLLGAEDGHFYLIVNEHKSADGR